MDFFNGHPGLRRAIAVLLAAIVPSACMTWQAVQPHAGYVSAIRPDQVRITRTDGRTERVRHPAIAGDSLTGWRLSGGDSLRVTIPTNQVKSIEVRRTSAGRTVLLAAGVSFVALVAVAALTFQGMKGSYSGFGGF